MKTKIFLPVTLVSILAFFSFSCSDDDSATGGASIMPEDNIITIERYIETPTRSGVVLTQPVLTAQFNVATSQVVSYRMSDEFLAAADMTAAEFDAVLREEADIYYDDLSVYFDDPPEITDAAKTAGPFSNLLECLKDCKDTKAKGEGRGRCRAGCWGDFVIELIPFFIPSL